MNVNQIQSAKKIQLSSSLIIDTVKVTLIDNEVLFVPMTNENKDYRTLQEWIAEGNTISEAE